jgi:hypothetical protein
MDIEIRERSNKMQATVMEIKKCDKCGTKIFISRLRTGYCIPAEEKDGLFGKEYIKHECRAK